ncbi:MAG TPA: hypothetical protein VF798_04230 [Burkholderiaceae bacterium]
MISPISAPLLLLLACACAAAQETFSGAWQVVKAERAPWIAADSKPQPFDSLFEGSLYDPVHD